MAGKAFLRWGSEQWQSLPQVLVQLLIVCRKCPLSFLLRCLQLADASLHNPHLPTRLPPCLSVYNSPSLYLCVITLRPCSTVYNKHAEFPGCCGFCILGPIPSDPSYSVRMSMCLSFSLSLLLSLVRSSSEAIQHMYCMCMLKEWMSYRIFLKSSVVSSVPEKKPCFVCCAALSWSIAV